MNTDDRLPDSDYIYDLEVRGAERAGGVYHRVIGELIHIVDGVIVTEGGEMLCNIGGHVVIRSEEIELLGRDGVENFKVYHIHVKDEYPDFSREQE